ncbi:MAG: 5-methyltetrahydrofolate--homocysteine methyltransferase [Crocinitomix sp.]|nr:5-methyltetrahydrofolate--homocysteine methyltransferase [Crocinitomix sp.]
MEKVYDKIMATLKNRIMIIDGAMGTNIQKYKLSEEEYRGEEFKNYNKSLQGNNDLLCITKPEVIKAIHRGFLEAGADIIETGTLCSSSLNQMEYGLEDYAYEMTLAGAKIAREIVDEFNIKTPNKPRYVAGSIGPTSKMLSVSVDVDLPGKREISYDDLHKAYKEQIRALIDGGSDLILVETIFDTMNCKVAIAALEELKQERGIDMPLMISCSIDQSGRLLSGQTLEAFLVSVEHATELISVGLNCSFGPEQMLSFCKDFSKYSSLPLSIYPNAGMPNEFGQYDMTSDEMGDIMKAYLDQKIVNMIGGCCGSSHEHIKVIADLANTYEPREFETKEVLLG